MSRDDSRNKSFTRRAFVIGGLQMAGLGVLGGRLAWLQLVEGDKYKTLAENNRINVKMIAPSRGEIVDRQGIKLVTNEQDFRVIMVPEQTDNPKAALAKLQKLIDLEDRDIKKALEEARRNAAFVPIEVASNLSWEEVAAIEVNLPDLPGLSIDVGEVRHYPLGNPSAHLAGYVAAVSRSELTGDPVLTLPGFKIGKTGIEKKFDKTLRGKPGRAEVEVNVVGREVRELNRIPAQAGPRLTLSVDSGLQEYAQDLLSRQRSASAIVMDAKTGAVYTLTSHPSFDPNMFVRGMTPESWESLLADPAHPLNNKAVGGLYPPGSTFKMVTALAGLEGGYIRAGTEFDCPGHYDYGRDRFHCWKSWGHGSMDVVDALRESCDTYFYKASVEIGIDKIARMARRFGFGDDYDFELPETRSGLVPDKMWKLGHFGKSWQHGETIVASIGQGYIQATPLQMAVMTARLVNGGRAVEPWIAGYVGYRPAAEEKWPGMGIRRRHLDLVKAGMDQAVNAKSGTAYKSRIDASLGQMGGKTGTAQVRRITQQERREGITDQKDLPWRLRHHALFVGYAPLEDPRYVCALVVDHGGGGSATAAPLARDLMREVLKRDPATEPLRPNGGAGSVISAPPPRKPDRGA